MKTVVAVITLVATLAASSAAPTPFFEDLDNAYLAALEDIVKNPAAAKRPFSVSIANRRSGTSMPGFSPLPESLWKRLAQRLAAKGSDLSGYVPADQLSWTNGLLIHTRSAKRALIYQVMEVKWLGDQRLHISVARTHHGLDAVGWTVVLEKSEEGWRIVGRTEGFFASHPVPGNARVALWLQVGRPRPCAADPTCSTPALTSLRTDTGASVPRALVTPPGWYSAWQGAGA
jgi:hypothetical protein